MEIPYITKEVVLLLVAWSLVWKGFALWKSARKGDKYWYIAMLAFGSLGILEMLYLFIFSKRSTVSANPAKKKSSHKK